MLTLPSLRTGLIPLILAAAGLASVPARAELVILDNGHYFKVRAYELVDAGERMQLTLPSGGRVTLPLSQVERVVADEVPLDPEPVPEPPPESPVFSWRFDASHPVPATPYGELIYATAQRHALNPALVAAVVRAESAFQAGAVSRKGARGLMQLMPATARRFGVGEGELFDPARNLEAGAVYLRWLLDRFDADLTHALAAYNAGEGTVDRYRGVPPFRETRSYIRRIYSWLGLGSEGAAGEGAGGEVASVRATGVR